MNNHNLENPQTAYSEMKIRCIINQIDKKLDKNQNDFWIIRTQLDQWINRDYLAFSTDYNISSKTKSLLINSPEQLVNRWATLTIKKKDDFEKVIEINVEKWT
jgi:hypothetical protein